MLSIKNRLCGNNLSAVAHLGPLQRPPRSEMCKLGGKALRKRRLGLRLALLLTVFVPAGGPAWGGPVDQAHATKSQPASKAPSGACSEALHRRGQAAGSRGEYEVGLCLLQHERLREAAEAFQAALHLNPRFGAAHNELGVVYLRTGNLPDAK